MSMKLRGPSGMSRRSILWAAGAAMLGSSANAAPAPAGSVENIRGEGYVDASGQRRWLAAAALVFIGDVVCTGQESRMGLKLGTRTQVSLGPEARLKLDRFLVEAGGTLVLERGALRADYEPGKSAKPLTVRSPFALLAVRGTRFFAGPSNGVFGVFVERGVVVVSGGGKTVTVTAGRGTNVASPGAQPTDPASWGEARIRAALASVS
jgi:ferric-dicitrate binding protein FerR (iron transport regulator)